MKERVQRKNLKLRCNTSRRFLRPTRNRNYRKRSRIGPRLAASNLFLMTVKLQPVVVVYLNSDLQKSLLSEGKFKQLIQSIPKRDRRTQQTDRSTWQTNSQSQVRSASFDETVSEESSEDEAEEDQTRELPLGVVTAERQIKDFRTRLNKIGIQFDLKTKQLAADESTDSATKSEMNNLLSVASDWIERAKSGLKEFEEQNNAKNKFKTELPLREKELADEKKLAATNLKTDWSFVPSSNSEAIAILQKKLQEQETWLQQSMNKRSEVRKQISGSRSACH